MDGRSTPAINRWFDIGVSVHPALDCFSGECPRKEAAPGFLCGLFGRVLGGHALRHEAGFAASRPVNDRPLLSSFSHRQWPTRVAPTSPLRSAIDAVPRAPAALHPHSREPSYGAMPTRRALVGRTQTRTAVLARSAWDEDRRRPQPLPGLRAVRVPRPEGVRDTWRGGPAVH